MFGFGSRSRENHLQVGQEPAITLGRNETVLNAALRHGIAFPHSCKVGGCAACKCRLVSGRVRELTDKTYLLSRAEIAQNFILACQSVPLSDVAVELVENPLANQRMQGRVLSQSWLTDDIAEIVLELDMPVRYVPGQHASLRALETDIPARCYSFAHRGAPEGARQIAFFVRRVPGGRLSNWLLAPETPGRRVELQASLGDFYLRAGREPLLCIAGGSGLAPLMALLEGALASGAADRPVFLLMGARRQRDLYYLDQIEQLRRAWQAPFLYVPVLSEEPADSGWAGRRGWVTEAITTEMTAGAQGYLCGPPPMIDVAVARMTALGIAPDAIYFDKFSDQTLR